MASTLIALSDAASNFELQGILDRIEADGSRQFIEGEMAILRSRFIELDKLIAGMSSPSVYQTQPFPARNGKD